MKKVIVANLKCNPKTLKEASNLFLVYKKIKSQAKIIVCPPFCFLERAKEVFKQKPNFWLGAQDCFYQDRGAFTGQVSALQLKSVGVKYVILGHSEKRALGDTDKIINQKVKIALMAGLVPVLCLGETKKAREQGKTFDLLKSQIRACLQGIVKNKIDSIILAYEPVWAIGSGIAGELDDVLTAILYLRKLIAENYSKKISQDIKVIYGGSISSQNADTYFNNKWIDGLLVGGASLDIKEFSEIAKLI